MDIQIRLSKCEDLEKILEIQACSLRLLSPSYDFNQIESLVLSQKCATDSFTVVAEYKNEYKNEIVGFASLMNLIPGINHKSQIVGMYVHPEFTRQGIGSQLLESIEDVALSKGSKVVDVFSSIDAARFYQAAGYELIHESGFYSHKKVWIPCKYFMKRLVEPENKGLEKGLEQFFKFVDDALKSFTSKIIPSNLLESVIQTQ